MLLLKDREIYVQPRAHTVHCCQEESMLPMFPMTPSSRWCKACRKCLMATSWSVLELWERKKFRKESWRMQEADKRSVEDSNCHLACNTMDMFSICQVPAISLRNWWGPKSEEVQVWLAVDSNLKLICLLCKQVRMKHINIWRKTGEQFVRFLF